MATAPRPPTDGRPRAVTSRDLLVRTLVVGLAAGFLSGLFGVGGGILIVPALVLVLGIDQRLAHGTSLAAVLPIAIAGAAGYALDGEVDVPAAVLLALGAATLGAVLGTYLLHVLPRRGLAIAFGLVMAATAGRMAFDTSDGSGRGDLDVGVVVALVAIGVLAGVLAGLLGVGGGIVMVPALVVLFGVAPVLAKGTSLVVIIPTSVVGTLRNRAKGNVDLRLAAIVGAAGVASSFAASRVSLGLDEVLSNRLFAALLVAVGMKMLLDLRKAPRDGVPRRAVTR